MVEKELDLVSPTIIELNHMTEKASSPKKELHSNSGTEVKNLFSDPRLEKPIDFEDFHQLVTNILSKQQVELLNSFDPSQSNNNVTRIDQLQNVVNTQTPEGLAAIRYCVLMEGAINASDLLQESDYAGMVLDKISSGFKANSSDDIKALFVDTGLMVSHMPTKLEQNYGKKNETYYLTPEAQKFTETNTHSTLYRDVGIGGASQLLPGSSFDLLTPVKERGFLKNILGVIRGKITPPASGF